MNYGNCTSNEQIRTSRVIMKAFFVVGLLCIAAVHSNPQIKEERFGIPLGGLGVGIGGGQFGGGGFSSGGQQGGVLSHGLNSGGLQSSGFNGGNSQTFSSNTVMASSNNYGQGQNLNTGHANGHLLGQNQGGFTQGGFQQGGHQLGGIQHGGLYPGFGR
ncbi:acanthoscurrin-2-like [Contarinia nasturtii]|uniref:acanthoscurrin-2-like n=1 Tax=Contarinia nasturtii TaxID=265458 RepID=UPI0012D37CDB|nr:acanthoscurrin-2-like [Contarinia nasturtii]